MAKEYTVEKIIIPSDGYEMKTLILRPAIAQPRKKTPGILWIHGGGYITGMTEMIYMSRAISLVKKVRRSGDHAGIPSGETGALPRCTQGLLCSA